MIVGPAVVLSFRMQIPKEWGLGKMIYVLDLEVGISIIIKMSINIDIHININIYITININES
jgi:hypothetical protein